MQNDIEVYEGGPISQDKIFFIIRGERATSVNSKSMMTTTLQTMWKR